MPTISTTTLANGGRVELSIPEITRNATYDLMAQVFDAAGGLVRRFAVDTATNSDGLSSPGRSESFDNFSVVSLSGGGFAIAYDDTVVSPPGGSNTVEIHLYDAAGGEMGVRRFGVGHGGEPYPVQGGPQLTATADGGVLVVASVGFGRSSLQVLRSDGTVEASKIYMGRPQSVYDAGDGDHVVVTLTRDSEGLPLPSPVREVLTHSLTPVSTATTIETRGSEGGDVLIGGAEADLLFGQGGADTLQGGASFDSLTGGPGRDKFVFAVDGSVDQVTDFDAAQDTLALVDANGAPIDSETGVLAFWRASGVLTYDPDGDQGPAAAETVAVLPGVKTLTQANLAPGYEPALLRIHNPITAAQVGQSPGSRSDLTFGYGRENYVSASADYGPTGTLLTYGVSFADGTSSMRWFDTTDAQPWENLVADNDAQGRLRVYAIYDDDGSHVVSRHDAGSTQNWQRIVDQVDAQGRIAKRDVSFDDGSRYEAVFDVAGAQPWGYAVEHFAAGGAFIGRSLFNDDGTPFG